MINAEDIIAEFNRIARQLERDGETPRWTADDIAVVIRNLAARSEGQEDVKA